MMFMIAYGGPIAPSIGKVLLVSQTVLSSRTIGNYRSQSWGRPSGQQTLAATLWVFIGRLLLPNLNIISFFTLLKLKGDKKTRLENWASIQMESYGMDLSFLIPFSQQLLSAFIPRKDQKELISQSTKLRTQHYRPFSTLWRYIWQRNSQVY